MRNQNNFNASSISWIIINFCLWKFYFVFTHKASTEIPESAKSVLLNVGGRKYEVLRKNLTNFPGSRLWKLVHANTKEEILRVCDRFKPGIDSEADFVPAEYFFDHNFTGFAEILDAYRSGRLHLCLVRTDILLRLILWWIEKNECMQTVRSKQNGWKNEMGYS